MGYFDFDFPHTHFYDSDLREILNYVRKLVEAVKQIDGWIENHETEYNEIRTMYEQLLNGVLTPALRHSLEMWVNANMESIIGNAIKTVFFGLTDDGYFVVYIPKSWDSVAFGTSGLDTVIEGLDYGHLLLKY